jgi:PAS domain S-box-containing protein
MQVVSTTTLPDAAILASLQYGVIVLASDGTIEYANPAARKLLAGDSRLPWPLQERIQAVPNLPASFDCGTLHVDMVEEGERRILTVREIVVDDRQVFIEAVLDNIATGVVVCDENGTLRLFNRATRTFHGLPEKPIPADQWAQYYDLYYPDGVTPMQKEDIPLYRAFQGEIVKDQEFVIAPKGGRRRTLLANGRSMFGPDGRKIGAVVAMRDITHRKLSSRRVREAFRHFRTLFNDAPIAYHEIDRQGIIRRVNRAECRLFGRSRGEILGHYPWDLMPDRVKEESKRAVAEKLDGTRPLTPTEREFTTRDGRSVIVEMHENHILDAAGRIIGLRTAFLDVTDRRRGEEQARAIAREKAARAAAETDSADIRSILERIGDAYMAFDTEWRYTYVNHRAAEFAQKPASELLGKCVWDEFPEAVNTAFYTELHRAMREQVSTTFENYFPPLRKWFENTVYPSPEGASVFYRDITDRKRIDQTLERRTALLAQKNAELEAFASMASHDLQEPLRMIRGYTGLLAKRYTGVLDEDADTFIQYAADGAARMQERISALLTLCRAGSLDPSLIADTSAQEALEYAVLDLAALIEENGARLEYGDLPRVRVVESHLAQLFQNLLVNAIRYRSEVAPVVTVSAERMVDGWRFSVVDNGIGFDMSYAGQIFRPFKRLRNDGAGTGMGLAICKKIVESRGGRIWVESSVGAGSAFHFTIPDEIPNTNLES